jgi:type IV pilus assembly protein PilX
MNLRTSIASRRERGIVLITSLLLLLVVTLIALSMFRSFGIQEKIAGNLREKARTLQAAISAEEFAENWMINGGVTSSAPVTCNALLNGNLGFGQICSNKLPLVVANITSVPWQIAGNNVGVTFTPTNMIISNTTAVSTVANPSYYQAPVFYISDMGASADASIPGEIYQIDAAAWGGNSNTVAVVESTFSVYSTSSNRTL